MQPVQKFSVELFVSAYQVSDQLELSMPNYILTYFFELTNSIEGFENELKQEYEGISKEQFLQEYEKLEEELQIKRSSLFSLVKEVETTSSCWVSLSDSLTNKFGKLYENYISQSKWSRNKPIKVLELRDSVLYDLFDKIQITAKEYVRIEFMESIKDELNFSEIYNPDKKIVKDKVADACLDELTKNQDLTVEELIDIILNKYVFKIYQAENDRKEVERKIKKAVRERHKYYMTKWNK